MVSLATNRPPNPEEYERICRLIHKHSRLRLAAEKKPEVLSRLSDRLQATGLSGYKEYCEFLESSAGEEELSDLLAGLAGEGAGFSRSMNLNFLAERILPAWTAEPARRPGDVFRVWNASCSSGEEAYSIAIVLAEFFSDQPDFTGRVAASDASGRMIGKAREGIYRLEAAQLPNPDWLRRYFVRGVGAYLGWWRVKEEIKHAVTFRQASLLDVHWPFTAKMDVIFCRDFIRFDDSARQVLSARLVQQLCPGGYLMAGEYGIYRKAGSGPRKDFP